MPLTASVLTIDILSGIVSQMAERCGFADESAQDTMLLLCEETGELARAIRRSAGIACAPDTASANVSEELADVVILALRLAAASGVDLGGAIVAKVEQNERRYC